MGITIRPMTRDDAPMAKAALDSAFNAQAIALTGRGRLPFFGDKLIAHRLAADAGAAFVAEQDGRVVGAIEGCRWGTVAIFGPVGVVPELQGTGIGQQLVGAWLDVQRARGSRLLGLETYAQSGGHHRLYGSFGFEPHWLSVALSRAARLTLARDAAGTVRFSSLPLEQHAAVFADLAPVAAAAYPGLDWRDEVLAVATAGVGDTVLLRAGDHVVGFAACHRNTLYGAPGRLFISLAAVTPGAGGDDRLRRLVAGVDALATEHGCDTVSTRVATRFTGAYAALLADGFHNNGGMSRFKLGPDADYERADHFILDSWL